MMDPYQPVVMFTLFYWTFAFCFVSVTPTFADNGISIVDMFSSWLGMEHQGFVRFHLKRTSITLLFHSALPSCYCLIVRTFGDSGLQIIQNTSYITKHSMWDWFVLFCTSVLCAGVAMFYFWTVDGFRNHPLRQNIELYAEFEASCQEIDLEFRSFDKYVEEIGSIMRVILLSNWLIKVSLYRLTLVRLDRAVLKQCSVAELFTPGETDGYGEFVKINAYPQHSEQDKFQVLISGGGLNLFKSLLRIPIELEPNVSERRTSTEIFLDIFADIVEENPRYPYDNLLNSCIGCDRIQAEVKLVKKCTNGECVNCNCPPLWCLECMGRWYASRQNQERTSEWLTSAAPCPMCRSKFCLSDVLFVE